MDFGFNEEQKNLGEVVGQVLADFPVLTAPEGAAPDYCSDNDAAVWDALAELGLFALIVPEAQGGVGLSLVDIALAIEALGSGLAPPLVASTLIATDLIARFGTPKQQDDLLPRLAAGQVRISLATQEAGQGYDPETITTTLQGDGVTGSKLLVAGGERADAHLVLARIDGKPGLAIVEGGSRGAVVRRQATIDPSCGFAELALDGATAAPLTQGQAAQAVARLVDSSATVYAGMQAGIAAKMLDTSVEYARTREQFGQPIGAFQAIKHRCADLAVRVDAARSAAYYAFWAASEDADDRSRASSMAKAYCGEVAREACNEAIQIHGGMGFTWELPLHRFLRRAKVFDHAFGSPEWHYERVLGATLAENAAPAGDARSACEKVGQS